MAQKYTRYVARDADGNVVLEGRVIALERALKDRLLGMDGTTVVVRPWIVQELGGVFVFYPPVPKEDQDRLEFIE